MCNISENFTREEKHRIKSELQNSFLPLFPFPSHHSPMHTPGNSLHPYKSFSIHTYTDTEIEKKKSSFFKNEIISLE